MKRIVLLLLVIAIVLTLVLTACADPGNGQGTEKLRKCRNRGMAGEKNRHCPTASLPQEDGHAIQR
jgi:hypothetical protein